MVMLQVKMQNQINPKGMQMVDAGIFSILTFSSMGPLIAVGNKKTLDLEDVPQLDTGGSVSGTFPTFRSKLESDCDTNSRVTTLKLVKALIFTTWKEIAWTALFAFSGFLCWPLSY